MAYANDAGDTGASKQSRDCNTDATGGDVDARRRTTARIRILTIILVSRSVELDM